MRDISDLNLLSFDHAGSGNTHSIHDSSYIELYWDIILLTESKFIQANLCNDIQFKWFRKRYLINLVSDKLNANSNKRLLQKSNDQKARMNFPNAKQTEIWRQIGDKYLLIYSINHNNLLLFSKIVQGRLIIIVDDLNESNVINCKDWLLPLMELTDSENCHKLVLYIDRAIDWIDLKRLLQNLNWIGGKIRQNEATDNLINPPTQTGHNSVDSFMSDSNFLIIEFDI